MFVRFNSTSRLKSIRKRRNYEIYKILNKLHKSFKEKKVYQHELKIRENMNLKENKNKLENDKKIRHNKIYPLTFHTPLF